MLGLTTTRHLRTVEADLTARLTTAYTSAELDRRRTERAAARERHNLRGRLDRALRTIATNRRDLATSDGALRLVSECLVDQHATTGTSR